MAESRNTSDTEFDVIVEGALAELTERAYQESYKSDPDFYQLIQKRMEKDDRLNAVLLGLSAENRTALEEYVATVNDVSAYLMKGMYIRGAKDCMLLLNKFPLSR